MSEQILELPCEFKGQTAGKTSCGIGVQVSRANLSLETADELFIGQQLSCTLILKEREEKDGQVLMKTALEMEGVFTTSSCRSGKDSFGTKLSGNIDAVDVSKLAKFANREGFLHVKGWGPKAEKAKSARKGKKDSAETQTATAS